MTVTREAVETAPSLVLTPAVVAHRGASGHRPEHTLDAYRTAIRMGVDDIELDLVATRERMPGTRPANTAYDGAEGVPTLTEVLAMVGAESVRRGRPVGLLLELKHAAHHDAIGLPLDVPLLRVLARHGLDHAWARVALMSFEPAILRRLAGSTRLPVIQLVEVAQRGLLTPEGLEAVDEYADGIGPHASLVLPRDAGGAIGTPSTVVRDAHRLGLTVHVWTLRGENRFLPTNLREGSAPDARGDLAGHVRALLAAGVDGLITDHPEEALAVLRER